MFWTMSRRVMASLVGFFVGWTIFHVVGPVEDLPRLERPAAQIVAIKLQSLGCSDAERECPVFETTLRSDGTGSYVGYANDCRIGKFEGTVSQQDFAELVEQIEKQNFFELSEHFSPEPVEETMIMEVITSDGSHRVTSYNWDSMPSELRSLHALIQYQTYYVYWDEVK